MFENTPLDFLYVGVALYVLGFGYALAATLRGGEHERLVFYTLLIAGFFAQSTGLYLRGLETHSLPVGNAFELLQALAWILIFLELILRATLRLRLMGLFAAGLAVALGLVSFLLPSAHRPATGLAEPGNPWIEFHVALAVFSYGVFALLAATSLMYLIQRFGLERKRFGGFFRMLPSLAELDVLNRQLLLVGAWVLTIAVALGVLDWVHQPGGVSASKLVLTILVWAGYLLVGFLRWRNRLVASSYAWSCVVLFAMAIFSLWPVSRHASPLSFPPAPPPPANAATLPPSR